MQRNAVIEQLREISEIPEHARSASTASRVTLIKDMAGGPSVR